MHIRNLSTKISFLVILFDEYPNNVQGINLSEAENLFLVILVIYETTITKTRFMKIWIFTLFIHFSFTTILTKNDISSFNKEIKTEKKNKKEKREMNKKHPPKKLFAYLPS